MKLFMCCRIWLVWLLMCMFILIIIVSIFSMFIWYGCVVRFNV